MNAGSWRALRILLAALAVSGALVLEPHLEAEAAPSLTLSPSSGDAPSVSGTLGGSGWECSPGVAPVGTASVSGRGASGSAFINRDGSLSGDFTVSGDAGERVDVTVTADASCPTIGPPIYLQATSVFRFDEAPPPTATHTRAPTLVPTIAPSATRPPATTNTPVPSPPAPLASATRPPAVTPAVPSPIGSAAPGETATAAATATPGAGATQSLTFAGCMPASPVEMEFMPLHLVGLQPPGDAPSGPAVMVPAVQGDGGGYGFVPPDSEPNRLFRVTPKTDDEECVLKDSATYWIAGQDLVVPMLLPGTTQLQVCAIGDKVPCEYPVVKGAFASREGTLYAPEAAVANDAWVTEKNYFAEDLEKGHFRFRSSTDAAASSARLQASVLPFPKTAEQDPFSPQGLVQQWDISCVNCEFTVDLSSLAPEKPPQKKSWFEKAFDPVKNITEGAAKTVWSAIKWTGGLVGIGGDGDDAEATVEASKVGDVQPLAGAFVTTDPVKLPAPTTFYFRLLPLDEAHQLAGAMSNSARLQQVDKPEEVKITLPTAAPTQVYPYEVQFLSYHGIIPPVVPNKVCYIATADAWPADFFGLTYTTDPSKAVSTGIPGVKKGQPICEPAPKEPSLLEAIVAWAEDSVNWASEAWSDLKAFAVDVILKYTPLGLQCSVAEDAGAIPDGACASAFAIALDATLVALGIPPDIPNFDQLIDEGVTYLAAEVAAQVAIPPDVVKAAVEQGGPYAGWALDAAEEELRKELQKEIEGNLKDAALSIQLGHAAAVKWVPDGIPVRPDDYQPPGATVRVTRKAGVPGGDDGCTLRIGDGVKLPKNAIDSPSPGYKSFIDGLSTDLSTLTTYDLFINEAELGSQGFPAGADKQLFVPPLAPGESYTIPMTFKPSYYKSGWSPLGTVSVSDYIGVWRYLHDFGSITLDAYGSCGADELTAPASAQLLGAEIVGGSGQ